MKFAMKRLFPLLIVVAIFSISCAEFYAQIPVTNDPSTSSPTPATDWEGKKTTCAFFWGLVPGDPPAVVNEKTECGIHDVKVTRDFWQGLCTVVTLGAISPVTFEWKLGSAPAREGPSL